MRYTWRWYGPEDPVSISDVAQTGANEVVTALHHIPNGEIWPEDEIRKRQAEVRSDPLPHRPTGLEWTIVESVPVHEDIKKRAGNFRKYIDNYKQTLTHLGSCGIKTVIYNFMPVLDWTRTDLAYELPSGAKTLKFDADEFAAFDIHILQRQGAEEDYDESARSKAGQIFKSMTGTRKDELTKTIIAGLPGAEEHFTLEEFRSVLAQYKSIDREILRSNLISFLEAVIPVAEDAGINMAIHPDDPPRPMFGLPRIMSNIDDIRYMVDHVPSGNCGLNICAGSFGVNADNDLVEMIREFGDRLHFVHLRSVKRDGLSFFEDDHLGGSVDLFEVVRAVMEEERRRKKLNREDDEIPIRPDHGHQMLDDLRKKVNPGYSCIGRMKGLAEIRGMATAINRMMQ